MGCALRETIVSASTASLRSMRGSLVFVRSVAWRSNRPKTSPVAGFDGLTMQARRRTSMCRRQPQEDCRSSTVAGSLRRTTRR